MASIQKKGKRYYIVTIINGKQKWIPGKKTKEETKKYMIDVLYKLENNVIRKDTVNITLKQYLKNWFNTYCINNLKLSTRTGYKQHIEKYISPRIGNIKLINLKPMDIQNAYYDILHNGRVQGKKSLNPKTVIQTHRILHKALKSAVMLQIINSNPCDYVELPKKKKYTYTVLQEEEIKAFMEGFKNTEIYLGVLLAITLGLRRGELLALLWSDIDFKNKLLCVNKALICAGKNIKLDTTKTESSNRVILLSNYLVNLLLSVKEERNASNKNYIIINLRGTRFNPSSFSRRYVDIRNKKQLKKVRFHDLRHTNASIMYKAGVKTKVMQERLGHTNISTTLDIYTHLFKEDQKEVASIFDENFFEN